MKRLLQLLVAGLGWVVLSLLRPLVHIRVAFIPAERVGHLAANTDLFLRRRQLGLIPGDRTYLFLVNRGAVANRQLLEMFKRRLAVVENPLLRMLLAQQVRFRTRYFEDLHMNSNEYAEFIHARSSLSFTPEEEARGQAGLRALGIGESDWYVCVYARDAAFLNTQFPGLDWTYHDYRNCDIDTFSPALQEITGRGGFVVRMGHVVEKPLAYKHARAIDYATHHRDEFMDVYLTAKCRFFLGSAAGIGEMAAALGAPRCGVNWTPVWTFPLGANSIYIPKKIRRRVDGSEVPYYEMIELTKNRETPMVLDGKAFAEAGYEYVSNSPAEIRDLVIEMIARMDGTHRPSETQRDAMARYCRLLPPDHWSYGECVPIGQAFLEKHRDLFFRGP